MPPNRSNRSNVPAAEFVEQHLEAIYYDTADLRLLQKATTPRHRHRAALANKAAKRARYAAESVDPVFGGPATSLAAELEDLQALLGKRQDSVAGREVLRELGVQAHLAGENGFAFGPLHAVEQRSGQDRQIAAVQALAQGKDAELAALTARVERCRWLVRIHTQDESR